MLVTAGGVAVAGVSDSNAPISQCNPCGRVTPRWSVGRQERSLPASSAGLPGSRAWVKVPPPLSASGPMRREAREVSGFGKPAGTCVVEVIPEGGYGSAAVAARVFRQDGIEHMNRRRAVQSAGARGGVAGQGDIAHPDHAAGCFEAPAGVIPALLPLMVVL